MLHPFIENMALRNSVNAALQRGTPVYRRDVDIALRNELKSDLKVWLSALGRRYIHWVYDADSYYGEIERLRDAINKTHSQILNPGMITLGVAQKCVSLYLKYLWLMGQPGKMPLFPPIDGKVMRAVGVDAPVGFKQIETRDQMQEILGRIEARARAEGYRTATLWEADWWDDKDE
ncbi:MAG: hypothetical protein K9N49_00590 [Candidatus Marinimicrobia bacterium]|nr:hypothetical protein [Candidatus Neomarinimicrobiota bacterium]